MMLSFKISMIILHEWKMGSSKKFLLNGYMNDHPISKMLPSELLYLAYLKNINSEKLYRVQT